MATWELKTGFVYHIYPTSEEAKVMTDSGTDPETGEVHYQTTYFGFHGNDVSPVVEKVVETDERTEIHLDNTGDDYEYFADGDGDNPQADGFLVFSESSEAPELVEGWEAEEWDCGTGWSYADNAGYKIVCVEEQDHAREGAGVFAVNM